MTFAPKGVKLICVGTESPVVLSTKADKLRRKSGCEKPQPYSPKI